MKLKKKFNMKDKFSNEFGFYYREMVNSPEFNISKRLDDYAEELHKLVGPYCEKQQQQEQQPVDACLGPTTIENKKILIVFVIDAFYISFTDVLKIEYEKFTRDFSEYLEYTVDPNKRVSNENTFAKINKDWYTQSEPTDAQIDLYFNTFKALNPDRISTYPPFRNTVEIRNNIDKFVKNIKKLHPEKMFYYVVLPLNIRFRYVMEEVNEYSMVYWDYTEYKEEIFDNFKNLRRLTNTPEVKKILIIFVFDGYNFYADFFQNYKYDYTHDFREYLEHA